jgi:S1-C subfamily serine protease
MKRTYIAGAALLALAALPLLAQKPVRVRQVAVVPEVAAFDAPAGHSYLGVGVADLTSDRVQALKLKDDRGVEILQVDQDAPAGKAGLKEHDVIVSFNGTPVESEEQFKRLMRETPPGRTVSLEFMRDGQPQSLKVQLADRKKMESSVFPREGRGQRGFAFAMPPMPPMPAMPDFPHMMDQTIIRTRTNSGVTLESLSPQLGDFFGVKNAEGMLVRSVQKGSPADTAGIKAGDVIVRIGDQKITDRADWNDAVRSSTNGKITVVIVRDKKEQTLSMSVPGRKGPDSSALFERESPDVNDVAEGALDCDLTGVGEAVNDALENVQRELSDNQSELSQNLAESMRLASSELSAHKSEIAKAMQDAQRALQNLHIQFRSDMQ